MHISAQAQPVVLKSNRSRLLVALTGLSAVGLALGVYAGCSGQPDAAPTAPVSRNIVASHADFFVGDLNRLQPHLDMTVGCVTPMFRNCAQAVTLQPHLDMTVGCVRLEYAPLERFVNLKVEYWKDGKPLLDGSASSIRRESGPDEMSISLTPVTGPDGKRQFRVIMALAKPDGRGRSVIGTTQDSPVLDRFQSYYKTLDRPVEIPAGPPVPVWAYLLHKPKDHQDSPPELRDGSFDEAVRVSTWAVVFKIGWQEPD